MLNAHPELIESLKAENVEFADLLKRHQELDKEVDKAGIGAKGISDTNLDALKRERLRVKDRLTSMLSEQAVTT